MANPKVLTTAEKSYVAHALDSYFPVPGLRESYTLGIDWGEQLSLPVIFAPDGTNVRLDLNTNAYNKYVGEAVDGATAVAHRFGNSVALANASAKLAIFTAGIIGTQTDVLSIMRDGGLVVDGGPGRFLGDDADGASAVALKFGNAVALANAGATIATFCPGVPGTAIAALSVMKDGGLVVDGAPARLIGDDADGASAIGVKIGNAVALANAGATIATFCPGVPGTAINALSVMKDGGLVVDGGPGRLIGDDADGASAVGLKFGNAVALANAGATIATFCPGVPGTAIAALSVMKDGGLVVDGAPARLLGDDADGASAIGVKLGNAVALANAAATIATFSPGVPGTAINALSVMIDGGLVVDGAPARLLGDDADGAGAIAIKLGNAVPLANATAKIVSFLPGVPGTATEVLAIDKDGKHVVPTAGGAATCGLAIMAGGTVTVNTTAVTANSIILLGPRGASTGFINVGTIVAGTSFVIQSTQGADTNTVGWWIIN